MFRSMLRRTVEFVVVEAGLARRRREKDTGRVAILSYHNVTPAGRPPVGDASLHLPADRFRTQLDFLQDHFDLVALDEIDGDGAGHRPRAAVTFDDAYRGALEIGLPELADRGVPATVFVCPGLLDEAGFWWDRLSRTEGGLPPELRKRALEEHRGRQRMILDAFETRPMEESWMLPGDREDLRRAGALPGVTLASHTWSHPNLAALPEEEVAAELDDCRAWLREAFPDRSLPEHLAFPYGLYDDRVLEVAFGLGFRRLYRVEGGKAPLSGPGNALLPRLNVPRGVSPRGFQLRVSGVRS